MQSIDYVIGIDIGGTNIRAGLVDPNYNLSNFTIENSNQLQSEKEGTYKLIEFIKNYINNQNKNLNIVAISIGFPSTVDKLRHRVISTPNIKGFNNINIVDKIEKELNIKTFINRDVNMLMLFDMFKENLSNKGIAIGFYLGTGLGNVISIDGNLLIGKNGSAGELGHIPIKDNKELCGCGNIGCVETFASGMFLKKICKEQLGISIENVFVKYSNNPFIEKYVEDLAIPIATEINILDPDYIFLGGGVIQMLGFPYKKLESAIYKYTRKPYPANTLEILYSTTGQENGVIGAGIYAYKML